MHDETKLMSLAEWKKAIEEEKAREREALAKKAVTSAGGNKKETRCGKFEGVTDGR